MNMKNMFLWYQQKIGTYDMQKWETNIEQREHQIYGLTHIPTRSTKANINLIDLDLVRGSSFTKAKPQHGFFEVVKLATMRCILFPFYGNWWIEQTSMYVFLISFIVYVTYIFNIFVYFKYLPATNNVEKKYLSSNMEIIIPLIMMWILSLIHSQIVATNPVIESKNIGLKRNKFETSKSTKKDFCNEKPSNFLKAETSIANSRPQEKPRTKDRRLLSKRKIQQKFYKKNDFITSSLIEEKEEVISHTDPESDVENKSKKVGKRPAKQLPVINISSMDIRYDSENETDLSNNQIPPLLLGDIASTTEWMGASTNSEDCSYSSDIDNISESNVEHESCGSVLDNDLAPSAILNPPRLRVSCIIWERNEIKKANLSVLDISSTIIRKVDSMPESMDYFYFGIIVSTILAFLPVACRSFRMPADSNSTESLHFKQFYQNITLLVEASFDETSILKTYRSIAMKIIEFPQLVTVYIYLMFCENVWDLTVMVIASLHRWILGNMFFFLLCVAERTFKQRLLYAKLFYHLTSLRRAKKSDLPHFRLNKVTNIKTWLSVRSYLKKRGPQRSVDVIVSAAFIVNLLLLIFLCVELVKDTVIFSQHYLEVLIWCLGIGTLILRFMVLGTKINRKYKNLSVLITEQINLHLQMEQKPHKKEEFTVANNVLKLAIDLLKELENPFKIYGLSANPILYNVTKLVILSALSGVLSEMLGFKLKLHKIKIK